MSVPRRVCLRSVVFMCSLRMQRTAYSQFSFSPVHTITPWKHNRKLIPSIWNALNHWINILSFNLTVQIMFCVVTKQMYFCWLLLLDFWWFFNCFEYLNICLKISEHWDILTEFFLNILRFYQNVLKELEA